MRRFALAGTIASGLAGLGLLGGTIARASAPARAGEAQPTWKVAAPPTRGFFAPSAGMLAYAEALLASPRPSSSSWPESIPLRLDAFAPQDRECEGVRPDRFYEFYFTRAIYSSYRGGRGNRGFGGRSFGGGSWSVDYPKADCQFISVVKRLAGLDMFYDSNAINLDDSRVRNFPFLYALEVGGMALSDQEIEGLRSYLAAGGFLVIDDFWGTAEWRNFEQEISLVLPDRPIVDLPLDHEVFSIFYSIDKVLQVPNVRNGQQYAMGCLQCTSESDGYVPYVKGIFDDKGRLMVIINWNTDLGDAWEWAEDPYYPLEFSTYAFEMGVNMILYSMTH